jgi:hypothetical protein
MATLALKAINYGADKIPDKAFHAVPGGYFRPEGEENPLTGSKKTKKKKSKGKREDRHRSRDDRDEENDKQRGDKSSKSQQQSSSESESEESDEEQKVDSAPPRRRNRRYQRSSDLDRGYNSDQGGTPDGYHTNRGPPPGVDYFPPPPLQAVDEANLYKPEAYNPHQYAEPSGDRDDYYEGHPREHQPYDPVNYQQPVSFFQRQQYSYTDLPQPTMQDSGHRSSSADRYRPANYQPSPPPAQTFVPPPYIPHAQYQPQLQSYSPRPSQANALAPAVPPTQPQQLGYPNQMAIPPMQLSPPPLNNYMAPVALARDISRSPSPHRHRSHDHRSSDRHHGTSSRDHRSRDRSRHRSKSHARSKSRRDSVREKLEQNKDIGASALGALAGGLLGNEAGHGRLSTLIGAALGGIGANIAEKKYEEKKKRHSGHRRAYGDDHGYDSY